MTTIYSSQDPYINLNPATSSPTTSTYTNPVEETLQPVKFSALNPVSSTMASVSDSPAAQQIKDAVVNGPVGQSVQNETAKTSAEFSNLANARTTPDTPAATGQPLTHYHSLFYRLLSWKDPRATGIVFATLVGLIFASRYLNILRYSFKLVYSGLGIVVLSELAGKATIGDGLATKARPKKYYTIRKESLERFTEDVEQAINFVVIEFQRIIFAENIWATTGAFVSSFLSYWLIKWLPLWGLTLLATCITFLTPLVYLKNKEVIDEHLNHAGNVINEQASQVRGLAVQHTSQATETLRSYAGEYSQKAQEMIGGARGKVNGPAPKTTTSAATKPAPKVAEFPSAPKHEPVASTIPGTSEPLVAI